MNGTPGPIGPTGLVGPTGPGSNSSTTCICATGITGLALEQTGIDVTADSYLYTQSGNCFELCGRININPTNNFVYVNLNTSSINGVTGNAVTGYSVDQLGNLTVLNTYRTGGIGSNSINLGPKNELICMIGDYLYVVNTPDGTISVFSIGSLGDLTLVAGSPFATGATGGLVASIAATPNGQFLYVNFSTEVSPIVPLTNIAMFSIDSTSGILTLLGLFNYPYVSEIAGMGITPNGKFLVATLSNLSKIATFAIGSDGLLSTIGAISGSGRNNSVTITCDGKFIYSGVRNIRLHIDIFTIDSFGNLSLLNTYIDNTLNLGALYISISPNNQFLFASGNIAGLIAVLSGANIGVLSIVSSYPQSFPLYSETNQAGTLLYSINGGGALDVFTIANNGILTNINSITVPNTVAPCIETFATPSGSDFLSNLWTKFLINANQFNLPTNFAINPNCTFGTWNVCGRPSCNQNTGFGYSYSGNLYLEYDVELNQFILFIRNNFDDHINNQTVFDPLTFIVGGSFIQ